MEYWNNGNLTATVRISKTVDIFQIISLVIISSAPNLSYAWGRRPSLLTGGCARGSTVTQSACLPLSDFFIHSITSCSLIERVHCQTRVQLTRWRIDGTDHSPTATPRDRSDWSCDRKGAINEQVFAPAVGEWVARVDEWVGGVLVEIFGVKWMGLGRR